MIALVKQSEPGGRTESLVSPGFNDGQGMGRQPAPGLKRRQGGFRQTLSIGRIQKHKGAGRCSGRAGRRARGIGAAGLDGTRNTPIDRAPGNGPDQGRILFQKDHMGGATGQGLQTQRAGPREGIQHRGTSQRKAAIALKPVGQHIEQGGSGAL